MIMVKKSIGIDIGRSHLRAVQIERTQDGLRIEKIFGIQTRRSTDSPVDILRSLTAEHGFDRHAEVAISLPDQAIFFADVEVSNGTLGELEKGNISSLRDYFPIPAEEAIVQVCSARKQAKDKNSVLVAATSNELLQQELDLLHMEKIEPTLVDTPITAALTALAYNHPDSGEGTALVLHVDELALSLAVIQDGHILMVRNIPVRMAPSRHIESLPRQITNVLSREIEITWQKLFGTEPETDLKVYLISATQMAPNLAAAIETEVECHLTIVDPYAHIKAPKGADDSFPVCVAEGLALRKLLPRQYGQVNFLAVGQRQAKAQLNVKKQLVVSGALLGGIIAIWFIGLILQLTQLESRYSTVKAQINDVFRQTLPEEQNIVNPLVQLQQALDEFGQNSEALALFHPGQLTPLETLYTLSTHLPKEGNLKLDDLFITADSIRVTGTCDSFATFSSWRQTLETLPDLHVVEIPNQTLDGQTRKVNFTLSLSSAKTVSP